MHTRIPSSDSLDENALFSRWHHCKRTRRFILALSCAALLVCYGDCPVLSAQAPTAANHSHDPTTDVVVALRANNFDLALQQTTAALRKYPRDYRLWTLRGMALAGTHQETSALSAYQQALRLAPDYLPALEGAAQLEYQRGNDRAKTLLIHVLALRPDDLTSHAMLAVLDYKENQCAEAVPHFRQAGELLEAQPALLIELASCLAGLNRDEEIIPVLQRVLALDPARPNTRYNLALVQWNAGHTQDAVATLGPLLDAGTSDEDVLTLAADIYESSNDTPRAVELLRRAIQANPKKADAYLQFSTLSYNHASLQVGIDMLNVGLIQLPSEPRLYLARAVLYIEKGDFTQAMDDFAIVNRLDPNLSLTGLAEGLAHSEQHKPKAAIASFRATAKTHPRDAFAQYLLAEALSEQELAPGTHEYYEALTAATRAATLDPKMLSALNLLSTLSLRSGDIPSAIAYSQKALSVDPNDPQALYQLLLALRQTNRKNEIPDVLKRLLVARKVQSGMQKKRFKLEEIPTTRASMPSP